MAKNTNSFSRVLSALALSFMVALSGCYDDSALQAQLNDHESRLKELERICSQANTNIEALQTIVSALQERDYVTGVAPIKEGDKVLGYTITFSKSGAVTIYHGKDGHTPVISVKMDTDGVWYWSIDGEWLLDSEGNKVKAIGIDGQNGTNGTDGVTPKLKIENGQWYVSYDGGETFDSEPLGQATGDKGYTMFDQVTYDEDYIYITMSDGQELVLPRTSVSQSGCVGSATVALDPITATTVTFSGHLDVPASHLPMSQIILYYSDAETFHVSDAQTVIITSFDSDQNFAVTLTNLKYNTKYSYCVFVKVKSEENYSDVEVFTTSDVLLELSAGSITATTAQITGAVEGLSESDKSLIEVGMLYSSNKSEVENGQGTKQEASEIASDNAVSFALSGLTTGTTYYYCSYVKQGGEYVYGEVKDFVAGSVSLDLSAGSIAVTTAQITGTIEGLSESDMSQIEVGMFYSSEEGKVENGQGIKLEASDNAVSFALSELTFGTTYYYCSYVMQGEECVYGEVKTFVTGNVSVNLSDAGSITLTTAQISGTVEGLLDSDKSLIEVGMLYSSEEGKVENGQGIKVAASEIAFDNAMSFALSELAFGTTYYYRSYVKQGDKYVYGEIKTFATTWDCVNLSATSLANCYIVSEGGVYKFNTVKGNSTTSVGAVVSASVLWESFGTSTTPNISDLIKSVSYKDGYIGFQTAESFKEGNAVIAAKDVNGNILWSWHIWLTDQPQAQVYKNNAGTMMDRNLGATSATPGDVGALGLLYQWGRKDPFLGSSSIHYNSKAEAKSTITWPSAVSSEASTGTIEYATANPTTFITYNSTVSKKNYDWYYTGSESTDNTRWTTSEKSIYDPCPEGWRVPNGDGNGVWAKASGAKDYFKYSYDSTNEGINFSSKFGSDQTIWYPASGFRDGSSGMLENTGLSGSWWSASPNGSRVYDLHIDYSSGYVRMSDPSNRGKGLSVRCVKE